MFGKRFIVIAMAGVAAVLIAAGCGGSRYGRAAAGGTTPDAGAARGSRAPLKLVQERRPGRIEGTQAFIALTLDGQRLRAYVLDGTAGRRPRIARWLDDSWGGRSPRTFVRDGVELQIDEVDAGGRVTGRLWAFGRPHAFSVEPARGTGGLYDGTDAQRRLGAS